jgi:hypothetical protein
MAGQQTDFTLLRSTIASGLHANVLKYEWNSQNKFVQFELNMYTRLSGEAMHFEGLMKKRYSEFECLSRILSERGWWVPFPFPRKQLLNLIPSKSFLDERKTQLEMWVNSLLATYEGIPIESIPLCLLEFFEHLAL